MTSKYANFNPEHQKSSTIDVDLTQAAEPIIMGSKKKGGKKHGGKRSTRSPSPGGGGGKSPKSGANFDFNRMKN